MSTLIQRSLGDRHIRHVHPAESQENSAFRSSKRHIAAAVPDNRL